MGLSLNIRELELLEYLFGFMCRTEKQRFWVYASDDVTMVILL